MLMIDKIRKAQRTAPVDVVGLAQELGIMVNESFLDADVSGELVRLPTGGYEINLNSYDPPNRKRFTLAHEIGHFVHHRDLIGDGLDDDKAYRSSAAGRYHNTRIGPAEETEANKFAARLLMPSNLIEELRGEGLTDQQVAKRLKVSKQAFDIRVGNYILDPVN